MSIDEWTFGNAVSDRAPERAIIRETGMQGLKDLHDVSKANGWDEVLYDVREEAQRRIANRVKRGEDR